MPNRPKPKTGKDYPFFLTFSDFDLFERFKLAQKIMKFIKNNEFWSSFSMATKTHEVTVQMVRKYYLFGNVFYSLSCIHPYLAICLYIIYYIIRNSIVY